MLWKLLKYDFRSMWKQFSIVWPAALVIGLINRFTLDGRFSGSDVGGITSVITISLFFGVMCAMFVVSVVFVLSRFYRGLLGDEGYLMHTLPVQTWQLVLSKLLCALVVTVVNGLVAAAAMFLMVPWTLAELFNWKLWGKLVQGLWKQPDIILYLVEFFLMMVFAFALCFTMLYLSMSIGHLFHKRRILMSVAAFFGLYILGGILTSSMHHMGIFWWVEEHVMGGGDHLAAWAGMAFMLAPTILMFLATSWILKRRLNLE